MTDVRLTLAYVLTLLAGLILQFVPVPTSLATIWPLWSLLLLAAWAMNTAAPPHLLAAFVLGIALDVSFNCVLGEHAVVLILATFIVMRARPTLENLPWWQTSIALAPLWVAAALLLMGLDHLSHHEAPAALRWWPVVTETLLWPLVNGFVSQRCQPRRTAA